MTRNKHADLVELDMPQQPDCAAARDSNAAHRVEIAGL
jgi:hypothetical protein